MMTPDWICLKPNPKEPCNHLNIFSDSCGRCGRTRYLSTLIEFETKLKSENVALAKLAQNQCSAEHHQSQD